MIKVALRDLLGRKLRAFLTAIAIVLGVAMVSGTYVLTDSIGNAFDTIFQGAYGKSDAYISGKEAFSTDFGQPPSFPASLLTRVRELSETQAAAGGISDTAKLIDKNGKTIGGNGPPQLGLGVDPAYANQKFNPLQLISGHWPRGPDQIAIDDATARKHHFAIGDTIRVSAKGPIERFRIVGTIKFGGVASIGGATIAVFDVPAAQRIFRKQGLLDAVYVSAKPGVTPQQLVDAIRPILPPTAEVRTGAAEAEKQASDTRQGIGIFQNFLLIFAGIALFVGAFIIFNSLSITVAQRAREFALLRCIGASRRQVLRSVIVEAFVLGAVASVVGLLVGIGIAKGLNSIFISLGVDLPQSGLAVETRTIVVSLLIGTLITVLASLVPAFRATRVPPVAILREGALVPRSRLARVWPYIAILVAAAGIASLAYGLFGSGLSVTDRLIALGLGGFGVFMGIALFTPKLVPPLSSALGWPGARFGGAPGMLARENATRNPGRTAVTAAALMIGITLVTFVSVFAQGIRHSIRQAINDQLNTDYIVVSKDGFTPFDPIAADAVAEVSGVQVSNVRGDQGKALGGKHTVSGIDFNAACCYRFDWVEGSDLIPAALGTDGAIVEKDFAKDHDLQVGSPFTVLSPSGKTFRVQVKGIYKPPAFGNLIGTIDVSTPLFDENFQNPLNLYAFVDTRGIQSERELARLKRAIGGFPDVRVKTQEEFVDQQVASVDPVLYLFYVLLGLSVLISLFGIVNTLVLSTFERTRELGMLRAVGMTRRQVRRMIRYESVITALIGAAIGIALGIGLAGLVTGALSSEGLVFSVPVVTLVIFAVIAVIAGLLAAILPARRASRLNVLQALQYE